MDTFLFQYHYKGSTYSIDVTAETREEAEGRLRAMPNFKYLGNNAIRIPAGPGAGLLVRAIVWWKNFWKGSA